MLREERGGHGGHKPWHACMHMHLHTHTPRSHKFLFYQSANSVGKEGNLVLINGLGIRTESPSSSFTLEECSYFTPKFLCTFLRFLSPSLQSSSIIWLSSWNSGIGINFGISKAAQDGNAALSDQTTSKTSIKHSHRKGHPVSTIISRLPSG